MCIFSGDRTLLSIDCTYIQCNSDNSNSLNSNSLNMNSCLIRIVAKFPVFLPYIKFEGKTCLIRIGIRTLSVICWHQLIMHVFRPLFLTFSSQLHDFSLHFCYFLCAYAILYAFPDNSNSLLIQFFFSFPQRFELSGLHCIYIYIKVCNRIVSYSVWPNFCHIRRYKFKFMNTYSAN